MAVKNMIRVAIVLLTMFHLHGGVYAQLLITQNPNKIKAAYLRNFTHYVEWPRQAFDDSVSPWNICVLGEDPFGDVLEKTFGDRVERGRSFAVHRAVALNKLPNCQIVYVAYSNIKKQRDILRALETMPVLTVGEGKEFVIEGGMVGFIVGERVEFDVNLDRAVGSGLTIQTKMLEVSHEVLKDGTVRSLR